MCEYFQVPLLLALEVVLLSRSKMPSLTLPPHPPPLLSLLMPSPVLLPFPLNGLVLLLPLQPILLPLPPLLLLVLLLVPLLLLLKNYHRFRHVRALDSI